MSQTPAKGAPLPRILVFGGGQLALSLEARAAAHADSFSLGILRSADCDITDAAAVNRSIDRESPALVINAAAYTAVDRAESEEALAFAVNALGPGHIARRCAADGLPFFHVSTDYVFNGENGKPWRVDDPTGPLGAYGRTKLAGEWAVAAAHPGAFVFRTSWVFSPWGNNFVKTMLRLARDRDELSIVADQHGCPTYAPDLADALLHIATNLLQGRSHTPGIHHFSNRGATTWHEFASAIFDESARRGGRRPTVRPIPSAEYPTPARRPAWSVLDLESTVGEFGIAIPSWTDALRRCMTALHEMEAP